MTLTELDAAAAVVYDAMHADAAAALAAARRALRRGRSG